MNSIQLREKRAALVNEMNHIVAAAQTEGRSLNAEENQKFDAIENDVRALGDSVEKIERAEQMKKEIAAGREARAEQKEITKREAFSKYLRHGLAGLNAEERSLVEQRGTDPQLTTPASAGGYLVPEDKITRFE